MSKKVIEKTLDAFKWIHPIEWAIIGIIVLIVILTYFMTVNTENDRKEFMRYCISKGNTAEDCKWEWKRIQNGKSSTVLIVR